MKLDKEQLLQLYTNLVRAREFDLLFARRLFRGQLLGFYHQAEGGEAPGVGVSTFLRKDDFLWWHLRGHGIPHMIGKGVEIKYFLAEHTGKATGMCGGMSTYHGVAPEFGCLGTAGTLGSNFPIAVGWGLAAQKNGRRQVVVSCFGDGGSARGTLHESFLMAANWQLPIIWVCENNQLGMFVPVEETHPMDDIASLAPGYGMPFQVVDGQDVVAVAEATLAAVERARAGGGPTFIECKTCRYHEHDIGTPDLVGTEARTEEEIEALRERDPVTICRDRLMTEGILTEEDVGRIAREAAAELEEAERFADESPVPDESVLETMLYAV
jgi:pyruvate dehydrogenase E1 component alpha subunit